MPNGHIKKSVANDIETMSSTNPNAFWNKIRKLGPRNNNNIPMEVLNEDGTILTTERDVLERWRTDFENLYNGSSGDDFDNDHFNFVKSEKHAREHHMESHMFECNDELNCDITGDEISDIVMRSKSSSACGLDEIPYSVLKYPIVIETLRQLFQLILNSSIIPTVWRKAIICPIHKDPSSDKRLPMNYRGVSLSSCIRKLYSSLLNKRIMSNLENNDILANEQNDFRKNKSC